MRTKFRAVRSTLSNLGRKSLNLLDSAIFVVPISPVISEGVLNVGLEPLLSIFDYPPKVKVSPMH